MRFGHRSKSLAFCFFITVAALRARRSFKALSMEKLAHIALASDASGWFGFSSRNLVRCFSASRINDSRLLGVICILSGGTQTFAHLQVPRLAEFLGQIVALLEHVQIIDGHVAIALILKGVQKCYRPDLAAPNRQGISTRLRAGKTNQATSERCYYQ